MAIEDLGRNGFKLIQPENCFKLDTAGVLLAWFAASFSRKGKPSRMLELGSGAGGCAMLVAARLADCGIDCVEVMKEPYDALVENIVLNNVQDRVKAYNCDVRDLPRELKDNLYDVVFANPPFYKPENSVVTDRENELTARFNEKGGLEDFISCASARTRMSSGYTVMCMVPSRLPECLELFAKYKLAPSRLISVHASSGKDAFLFLLAGKKGSPNTEFKVLPPLFMDSERINRIYTEEHTDCFI
jgi:tRNA1(Val) A37 N6-methylase TrmN6